MALSCSTIFFFRSSQASLTALPQMNVWLEPNVPVLYGVRPVSAAVICTLESGIPRHSAAIWLSIVSLP